VGGFGVVKLQYPAPYYPTIEHQYLPWLRAGYDASIGHKLFGPVFARGGDRGRFLYYLGSTYAVFAEDKQNWYNAPFGEVEIAVMEGWKFLGRGGVEVGGVWLKRLCPGVLNWILVAEVWRGMFGAEMIPAGIFFVLLFLVPESPRWLVDRQREKEALRILSRIDGAETAQRELAEITRSIAREEGTLHELFRPGLRAALLVGVGLSFFGQLTGVNIVVYYGPSIMRAAGLAIESALQYQVALGIINLVFTVVAIWKIDSWGRRPLLIGGMALVALSMGVTALLMALDAPALWIVALLCAYMACVAVSICAVIWVLTPEIFPNRVRGRGASISTFTNWTTNAFSAFVFPWYVASLGMHAGFFTFGAICCVATVFFWKLVPETKGKSLEQIEEHWLSAAKTETSLNG